MAILHIDNVSKRFAGLMALAGVDFAIQAGSIKSLIGPNGAGKTTLFQIISRVYPPTAGRIIFEDEEITRRPAHQICALGIGRTFQLIRLFPNMTVADNVMTGRHVHMRTGVFLSGLRLPATRREERRAREEVHEILGFMGIGDKAGQLPANLPYGQQRLVEISRALASKPKLLLLDEPAAGMNPQESDILAEKIGAIKAKGVTVFLVEHHMGLVMDISDGIVVLNYGQVIAEGSPEAIQENPAVIEAYLGAKSKNA